MAYNIPANGEPPELSEGGLREAEGVNATGAQVDLLFGVLFYLSQTLDGQASSLCKGQIVQPRGLFESQPHEFFPRLHP